jgi:CubicO group peptidase (beta-lactamase class C family)
MTRTTSVFDEFMAQDNRATLHVPSDDGWVVNGNRAEQAQAPAGQVSTSANDFATWMIMMLNEGKHDGSQVVDAEALAEAHIPRVATEEQTDPAARTPFYGYGLSVRTDSTGRVRNGWSGAYSQGAATNFTLLPSEELGIAVFTNAYPLGMAEGLTLSFLDSVELGENPIDWFAVMSERFEAALSGEGAESDSGEAIPERTGQAALPLERYVGTYDNVYYGPLTVTADGDGALVATVGPNRTELALVPFAGNIFGTPDGAGGVIPAAEFTTSDGQVATLELAALQAPDNSVFRKTAG